MNHKVEIGTLVEITTDCKIGEFASNYKGVRLFVVGYHEDCDGSPLYKLSFDQNAVKYVNQESNDFESNKDSTIVNLLLASLYKAKGQITDGWGEDSFVVVNKG